MKYITKNLMIYAILFFLYTLLFRFVLSSALDAGKFTMSIVIGIVYGILIFFTAWYLGKGHSIKKFVFDAGLGFNVTTFIIWGILSEFWFVLGYNSNYESIRSVHLALIIWAVIIIIHFFVYWRLKRLTIKGLLKSEIFD